MTELGRKDPTVAIRCFGALLFLRSDRLATVFPMVVDRRSFRSRSRSRILSQPRLSSSVVQSLDDDFSESDTSCNPTLSIDIWSRSAAQFSRLDSRRIASRSLFAEIREGELSKQHSTPAKPSAISSRLAARRIGRLVAGVPHEPGDPSDISLTVASTGSAARLKVAPVKCSSDDPVRRSVPVRICRQQPRCRRPTDLSVPRGMPVFRLSRTPSTAALQIAVTSTLKLQPSKSSPGRPRRPQHHLPVFDVPTYISLDGYPGEIRNVMTDLIFSAPVLPTELSAICCSRLHVSGPSSSQPHVSRLRSGTS